MQLSTTANGTHGGGSAYSTGVTYELDGYNSISFHFNFSSASSRKLIIPTLPHLSLLLLLLSLEWEGNKYKLNSWIKQF